MSIMVAEIYEALVEAGTSDEKARAAASVVAVTDNLATKADVQDVRTQVKELRTEMYAELKVLKFAVFSLYPFILAMAYRIFS